MASLLIRGLENQGNRVESRSQFSNSVSSWARPFRVSL